MSTGKHPAEVLADRLESDDPEFDDCADAGDMLRTIPELEAEIEGLNVDGVLDALLAPLASLAKLADGPGRYSAITMPTQRAPCGLSSPAATGSPAHHPRGRADGVLRDAGR